MKLHDHTGQTWRVSRRWVPWRRRLKGAFDVAPNLPLHVGDGPFGAVVGAIFLIIMIPFLILALIAGLELLLVLLVLPFAVLGRVLFGKHWTVEVRKGFLPWFEMPAGNWADSRAKIDEIAAAINRGELPPRTLADPEAIERI